MLQIFPLVSTECPKPPKDENGKHTVHERYLSGASVTYTCSPGYRLLPADEDTITCTDDGSWSGGFGGCYSG